MTKEDGDAASDEVVDDVPASAEELVDSTGEEAAGEETAATEAESDGAPAETLAADADDAPVAPAAPSRRGLFSRLLVPVALAVLLLGSAGLATWIYLEQFRPDRQTNAAVATDTIKAASDGAIALLSYAPETMDKDFAAAKSHLTGSFLDYYSQFTHDIVTPAVQQKAVKTSATIVQSAVSELHPDSAVVLVFLNQTTTSKENPNGSFTASSVKVGLTKVNGTWLISAFDPV